MRRAYVLVIACASAAACRSADPVVADARHADAPRDAPADARPDARPDAAPPDFDGPPTRESCTSSFGTALTAQFGRLDGYLVAIVPPSTMQACNADLGHVHLQIKMGGAIYDVAIDATDDQTHVDDVHTTTRELAMPGPAWSEGWHTGLTVDYPTLGIHATDLPLDTEAEVIAALTTDLAAVNHISVYATGYGPDGGHLVHRNGAGTDGLLITEPLSAPAHVRFVAFTGISF